METQAPPRPAEQHGFVDGMRAAWPLAVVVGVFGISWGVLAQDAGMSLLAAAVMSATTFGGSAQFAAISIIGEGGSLGAAIVAAVLLNARYGPIGLSVAPALGGPVGRRFVAAQLVVDESWAIANRGDGRFDPRLLMGAGALIYFAWLAGTVAGILGGDVVGDPGRLGFDAAFPALFLSLLAPQVRERRALVVAIAGAAIALALVPFTQAGVPIIAAAAACLLGLRRP